MARYWRMSGIRTASNMLDVSALSLFDGSSDHPASVLTGALSSGFKLEWDLGSDIPTVQLKATSITQADFPTSFLLETSGDAAIWILNGAVDVVIYPGDGATCTINLGDVYFTNVALLLHGNGLDTSTVFLDSSLGARAVTAYGSVQISTLQSKFGGASMSFDGAGDYLSVPHHVDLNLSAGDFTVEAWVWVSAFSTGNGQILDKDGVAETSYSQYNLNVTATGKLSAFVGNGTGLSPTGITLTGTTTVSTAAWHHVAMSRLGSTIRLFLDGTLESSAASPVMYDGGKALVIGYQAGQPATVFFNGYLDDLRVTKGVARYVENFPVPVTEFSSIAQPHISTPIVGAVASPSGVTHIPDEFMPPSGLSLIASQITALDQIDGGTGSISGTVAEKHLPTNTPLARRVVLMDERSRRVVRETWSDASGSYVFPDINTNTKYTVLSYDHTGTYRAVIADNLSPTPL